MKEKEQSSIEWLVSQVTDLIHESNHIELVKLYEQAKELHKKEIIESYMHGDGDAYNLKEVEEYAKQYYNEKYSQ